MAPPLLQLVEHYAALLAPLFLLLLSSSPVLPVHAQPSGCWTASPANLSFSFGPEGGGSSSAAGVQYFIKQLQLCFINSTYHNLSLTVYVKAKGYSPVLLNPATMTGLYAFEAPQSIVFAYANDAACVQAHTFCCDLCPRLLDRFAGKFGFEALPSLASPSTLMITPDSVPRAEMGDAVALPYQWGSLDYPLPMGCSSGCGSFSGVVPNPYSGGNVSYTVRRFLYCREEQVIIAKTRDPLE
jgi:hypothetical protein